MASSSNKSTPNTNTIFVQTDASNFRAVVQKLTGLPQGPASQNPAFKLHERRKRKLQIKLDENKPKYGSVMASPVSTLDLFARGSPKTPCEEEEKAIAAKGFYLHPNTPRRAHPPQLLSLFPVQSPKDCKDRDDDGLRG